MKSIYITLFILFFSNHLFGQYENNIWHFGQGAGLDFNYGSPKPLTDAAIAQLEGCASIADSTGRLLFYTDGRTVWDRNHTPMPNGTGLKGHYSSTESAIIIHKPGSKSLYYIFTADGTEASREFRYSEVDITVNGGRGDVTDKKNILLLNSVGEKITAIKHSNDHDIWVITHEFNSDAFHCFLVTDSGVNLPAVVSNTGTVYSVSWNAIGYLKASYQRDKIAVAIRDLYVELFDFNNTSGLVSNPITLDPGINKYGLEFSPDGTKLYSGNWTSLGRVYQYDLTANTPAAIINSKTLIGASGVSNGALQLGPDGKIYVAMRSQHYLSVINYPDSLGLSCQYRKEGVYLGNRSSTYGLPPMFEFNRTLDPHISAIGSCLGDSTYFEIYPSHGIDSVLWDFDDTPTANNASLRLNPWHVFSDTGHYNVKTTIYSRGRKNILITPVHISGLANFKLGNDTVLCSGETLMLDATATDVTYLWQDNSTDPTFNVTQSGTYWVQLTTTTGCGIVCDSINVHFQKVPIIDLGSDTTLCEGEILILDATTPIATYLWQDISTNPTLTVTQGGAYWVELTVNNCRKTSSTLVASIEKCEAVVDIPNVFTPNADGINDLFSPIQMDAVKKASIFIYNRWGKKLFESNNVLDGWNGKSNGKDCVNGTYYWMMHYTDHKGFEDHIQGQLTLIR